MDIVRTKELFAPLIQRPTLTDQLLQRPPFKFLHDIVRETIQFTGYPSGLFSENELDSQKAGSSRENKISFLQKLIDVLNVDGNLDNVKPAKIVAGKEPEMTNLLLQSLASEASTYMHERKKLDKKVTSTTKSKTSSKSSSSKLKDQKNDSTNNKEKTTKTQKSRSVEKEETGKKSSKNSSSQRKVSSKDKLTKENDKERRKKRTDSIKNDTAYLASPSQSTTQQQQISDIIFDNTSLPDSRRTPPDRESSGGTSKGDDSGIAEETGAESERHDISETYGGPPFLNTTTAKNESISMPEFSEIHHSPTPSIMNPQLRLGTAVGRPRTATGRPGTAIARPAPPKPKKNIIATNLPAESQEQQNLNAAKQLQLVLAAAKDDNDRENTENFLLEEEDERLFLGMENAEGASIIELEKGEDHGVLVNKIIENARELEKEHMQEGDTFVQSDDFDVHEQRRIRIEIESTQKSLQRAMQNVQPLVRTLEFVIEDFDAMLRELEESRKQIILFERQLIHSMPAGSQPVKLDAIVCQLDIDINNIREEIAHSTNSVLRNEQKIAELLLALAAVEMKS